MKNKVYYHGTSADNLEDILRDGLKIYTNKIWNCSCDEIYLWSVDEVAEAEGIQDQSQKEKEAYTFNRALESAQFSLAKSKDCRAVVIRIELSRPTEPDESAPNMRGSGAVCYVDDIGPACFTDIHISEDLSLLKGAFIGLLMDHEYNNVDFTELELKIGQCFKENESINCYLVEDLPYKIEWEKKKIKKQSHPKKMVG